MGDEEAIYLLNSVFKGLFSQQLDMDGPPPQIKLNVLRNIYAPYAEGANTQWSLWKGFGRQENWTCSYLYGHHGQHLHGDPVKLVKAAPRPRLSQAFVDAPTGLVDTEIIQIDTVGQEVGLSGSMMGDLVRLRDKACGKADRDVSPISQKIYGRNILCSNTAAWE